ncbi:hypothetical protein V502_02070 [Pseudogymnoascus sp. VKM F-4520 (FW-2644)]|nr:hypothetical protein V502_02070 [Pseudogymnoascus sp. VKM F-4520 (FW-2644)]
MTSTQPKTRLFAGATLLDTPVISAALEFAKTHHDTMSYNHTYRSWIFGTILASKMPEFANIDYEVHAVSAILHDLAWDYQSVFSSPEKRFEVDGANAAIDFLNREAPHWDGRRRQLVWDSIALHTTTSIARYKEPEVALCNMGTFADFTGAKFPGGFLSQDAYNRVVKALPLHNFKEGVKKIMCGLCLHKPETTYDNFVKEFGISYVPGYQPTNLVDQLLAPIEG